MKIDATENASEFTIFYLSKRSNLCVADPLLDCRSEISQKSLSSDAICCLFNSVTRNFFNKNLYVISASS